MAQFDVVDMNGKKVSTVELSDAVFGITPNEKAVHEAVVNFLANQRQGTQNTKIRKEVRGGGKKPWRQKGTGHARQGSIRAPQWTHGGVALGPKPRSYYFTINKKVKRLALLSALSDKAANGNLIVVDKIAADEYKTKTVVAFLAAVGAARSLGARRAPATLVRALSVLRSGPTAVLLWAPSPAATTTPSTRRSSVWLCSAPCLTRLPTAT